MFDFSCRFSTALITMQKKKKKKIQKQKMEKKSQEVTLRQG